MLTFGDNSVESIKLSVIYNDRPKVRAYSYACVLSCGHGYVAICANKIDNIFEFNFLCKQHKLATALLCQIITILVMNACMFIVKGNNYNAIDFNCGLLEGQYSSFNYNWSLYETCKCELKT